MWLVTVSLFVITLAFFEWFWRHQGHLPSVPDNVRLWAIHRADVYESFGKKKLVIVGASRAQTGLVPSVVGGILPEFGVKMLAVAGSPTTGVIEDLCRDPDFSGIVLWDIDAQWLSTPPGETRRDYAHTRFFHDDYRSLRSLDKNANCVIAAWFQSRFVTLSPRLTLPALVRSRFRPEMDYVAMDFDRYRITRYGYGMLTPWERERRRRHHADAAWRKFRIVEIHNFDSVMTKHIRLSREMLRARGGDLLFLRMPTTGDRWVSEQISAPRASFWNRIDSLTGATTIHFRDYPELSEFDCPDMSHLDASDAPEFTRRLALILRRKLEEDGILPATKPPTRRVGQSAFAAPATAPR